MCHDNRLTVLSGLPAGLKSLCFDVNLLSSLSDLPESLEEFLVPNNNNFEDFTGIEYYDSIPDYVARLKAFAEAVSRGRIVARCAFIFEELAQTVWHPSRVERRMLAGVDMEDM